MGAASEGPGMVTRTGHPRISAGSTGHRRVRPGSAGHCRVRARSVGHPRVPTKVDETESLNKGSWRLSAACGL
ncbi:unnamed protein product [Rangifer tarandus platyrhynchus]|uniref:Uncharacterized protein n=2 Tax=Rangifer tarandus platyrhynchus TaxID=3082113 RepID=A0ABN8Z2E4_RANTA|nr:unnamed protein product [Rangifer tarandus platyrhynchus]CAI9693947.1 unnamed protein product [Rangifer tarandus platyrhynchus]